MNGKYHVEGELMNGKYHVTYRVTTHPEGLSREDVMDMHATDGDVGACDCVLIASIIGVPGEGEEGLSVAFAHVNGTNKEPLTPSQMFPVWTLLAHELAETLPPGGRRDLCQLIHDAVRNTVRLSRGIPRAERIACAAIQHGGDGTIYTVPQPGRHHDVIQAMIKAGKPYNDPTCEERHVQGFLTDTGRFVDREEACHIARDANQIIKKTGGDRELFSEDVW